MSSRARLGISPSFCIPVAKVQYGPCLHFALTSLNLMSYIRRGETLLHVCFQPTPRWAPYKPRGSCEGSGVSQNTNNLKRMGDLHKGSFISLRRAENLKRLRKNFKNLIVFEEPLPSNRAVYGSFLPYRLFKWPGKPAKIASNSCVDRVYTHGERRRHTNVPQIFQLVQFGAAACI